jgi:glutamate racemase
MNKLGILDSGMGGLSVLKFIHKSYPGLDIHYYGDLKNAPYGLKTTLEVLEFTRHGVNFLRESGCDRILIACNTATSASVATLREEFKSIQIYGMEPAIRPALKDFPEEPIVVLATPLTLSESRFQKLKETYGKDKTILSIPCPGLSVIVDECRWNDARDYLLNIRETHDLKGRRVFVLGCTHYVFLKSIMAELFPDSVYYDGVEGTSNHIGKTLDLLSLSNRIGQVTITMTDESESSLVRANSLINQESYE